MTAMTLKEIHFNGDTYSLLEKFLLEKWKGFHIVIVSDNLSDNINDSKIELYINLFEHPGVSPPIIKRITFEEYNKNFIDYKKIKKFCGNDIVYARDFNN